MRITIYHNPACSNSRGALAILKEAQARDGFELEIVEYLKTPPTRAALERLAAALAADAGAAWPGLAAGMMREKETPFAQLGLAGANDAALLDALAAHPILLNRPIVEAPKGTRLCRPPELVRGLL